MHPLKKIALLLSVLALVLTSCGGESHESHARGGESATGAGDGFTFGESASPEDATRTLDVTALDAPEFAPSTLEVEQGEVVTFEVTNEGKAQHEFVLGDEAYQEEHHQMMAEGHGMAHGDNAVELAPGETAELTWRFSGETEVLFACHVAGHYEAGMVGTISIS